MKIAKNLRSAWFLAAIVSVSVFSVACGGDNSSTTSTTENKDSITDGKKGCDKNSAEDWDNFLGIEYGTNELGLEAKIGKFTGGEYTADSSAFIYYFKRVENAPVTVWVNGKTGDVETIFMEILGYEQYFQTDLEAGIKEFNMQDCDSRFFGMTYAEVTKIMGKPSADEELEGGVKSISYDSKNFKYSVNFKFYPEQADMCSSISVNWFY